MSPADSPPPSQRPQFSLASLLLAMLTMSVTFAAAYYLVRGQAGAEGMELVGIVLLIAGPLMLLVAVSAAMALVRRWGRRG